MRALLAYALQVAVSLTWTPSTTPNATTTLYRDGQPIAQSLTAASYVDSSVSSGLHTYTAVAVAPQGSSAPSDPFQITVPPELVPTTITFSQSTLNANFTRVTAVVRGTSGAVIPTGVLTWSVGGVQFFTTTLSKSGVAIESFWTTMLNNLPVTITYSGSSLFSPSTITTGP